MAETQIVEDVEASPLSKSMQHNPKLEKKMQRKLEKLWGNTNETKNFTIFRTPLNISYKKEKLFYPSVISIGPFHRHEEHLRGLEEQKWRFLKDFLNRGNHISLDRCLFEMQSLEKKTRWCYGETVDLKSNAFVEMMLLDGCFVLEFFLKLYEENLQYSRVIYRDLLLLENQIPFFIVEKLYEIGFKQKLRMNFVKSLVHFLARDITIHSKYSKISDKPPDEIHHLVHLCYHCFVPSPKKLDVRSPKKPCDLTRMFSNNRIIKGLLHRFRSRSVRRGRSPHSTSGSSSLSLLNSTGDILDGDPLCH